MSPERQEQQMKNEIADIMREITNIKANNGERYSIKKLEATKKKLEEKIKKLSEQSKKDDVVTFEELGVDKLFVDEAHYFKNLMVTSKMRNVAGISQTDAKKSSDLYMKCRYLDELTEGKGIVFATGTPVSNSMVELYTMQRYLQYETLKKYNILNFDAWASLFGENVTAIELSPDGTGYRSKVRFAKFYNLPELISIFKEVADIKTSEMLDLPVPNVVATIISAQPSEIQKEMVKGLGERADEIRKGSVDPREDNMLRITNEGRKLALDQRLINEMLPDDPNSKVNLCVENIYKIWLENEQKKSTQLLFCDLSTPKNDGKFNVYDDIKNKLIAKGVPSVEIDFIHNADNEVKKKTLFEKTKKGLVRFLLGSTQKMGAGTNVQNKVIALHHLDVPWKPSDIKQRNGRGVRQGNENSDIQIYSYVTEGTFDAYSYQILEQKQKFISQIFTSKIVPREQEDLDKDTLSYAEIKALATGDKNIVKKMELDTEVARLNMLKQEFLSQKYRLEDMLIKHFPSKISLNQNLVSAIEKDIKYVEEKTNIENEEKFSPMILKDLTYTKKEQAGNMILEICKHKENVELEEIGEYRGMKLLLEIDSFANVFKLKLRNNASYTVELGSDVYGNITRIDNAINGMADKLEQAKNELAELKDQFEKTKVQAEEKFIYEEQLATKLKELRNINAMLNLDKTEKSVIMDDEEYEEDKEYSNQKEYVR